MSTREFWIDLYSWTAHRTKEEIPVTNKVLQVREVSPAMDVAWDACERALLCIVQETGTPYAREASEALAILRKARGE